MAKVKVTFHMDKNQVLAARGLGRSNHAKTVLASTVARLSDPYVPMQGGALKNDRTVDKDGITYNSKYAHYHYIGKLMVDPNTGSSYARRGVAKVYAEPPRDMDYHGAPMRGPRWVERMMIDRGEEVIKAVTAVTGGIPEK